MTRRLFSSTTRREFLGAAGLAGASRLHASAAPAKRPNIVFILADDLGYADLSCFQSKAVRTPHLDRLAAEGTRMVNFYAASAVCSPSRAAILTGRYPLRYDIRRAFTDDEAHLPVSQSELPHIFRRAGYSTAHVGKWHLGGLHLKHIADRKNSIPGPHQHGFDHYLCQNEEQPMRGKMGKERTLYRKGGTCLIRNEQSVPPSDPYYPMHWTDIVGAEAVRSIERMHAQRKPFFLNVWFLNPHAPYEPAPEPHWSRTAAPGISEDQHCFRSMVEHMDAKVGEIVAKLDELGIRDNTLLIFTSDNGGAWESDVGPYKGGKTDLHEGGLRVPAIFHWKGVIPAGKTSTSFGHHCDLLPTLCDAVGIAPPREARLDGVSLWDCLAKAKPCPARGPVFWQMDLMKQIQRRHPKPQPYATEVARTGSWKMLATDGRPLALFDLDADPTEQTSVLDKNPEVAGRLAKELRGFLTAERNRSGFPSP